GELQKSEGTQTRMRRFFSKCTQGGYFGRTRLTVLSAKERPVVLPRLTAAAAAPHRGPRGHVLLGSLRDLNRDQLGFYTQCAREYGDVVPVRLGPFPALLIYHPDVIEEVLVARNRDFIKRRGIRLMRALLGMGCLQPTGIS